MSNFNLRNYMPVVIVIFFLLILTSGGLLLWPKMQESRVLQNDIKAKQAEIEQAKKYFKKLKDLKIQLETDYLDELSKISAVLPANSSVAMPSFLKYLQEAALQSGLILTSINPSTNVAAGSGVKELKVDLSVTGAYTAFKNFLTTLENSSKLIEVESVSFSSTALPPGAVQPPGSQANPALPSFTLQVKTFTY